MALAEATSTFGEHGRSRRFAWIALVSLLVCFEIDQLHALVGYSMSHTDEDQTLLWFAGRELLHLHLHEPNFYGQAYNTVFEALPGGLFHQLGVSLALANPLGTMLMASACWLVLAWAALRRGQLLAAVAALALPVCLCVPYLLLFDAPRGVLSGDLAGAVAVAAALIIRQPRRRLAALIAVGGLAIAWENAVALAVLPALAASTVSGTRCLLERPRRTLLAAGAAALVPIGWLLLSTLWYRSHPVDLTAHRLNSKLELSVLGTNLSHLGRLFGFYKPQLWQQPAVFIVVLVAVVTLAVVISITARNPAPFAAGLTFLVVLLVILSSRATLDRHPDLYLSGSRFLVPMPLGLWVVLYHTLSAVRDRAGNRAGGRRRLDPRIPIAVLVAVAATSMIVAQTRFGAEIQAVAAVDAGARPVIPVQDSRALLAQCAGITRIYRHARADLLVTYQRSVAYGCAAESGINTIDQDYDRRGWLLQASATQPVGRILMQGWTCRAIPRRSGTCRPESPGIVLLLTPPRPPNVSLALAAAPLRGAPRTP